MFQWWLRHRGRTSGPNTASACTRRPIRRRTSTLRPQLRPRPAPLRRFAWANISPTSRPTIHSPLIWLQPLIITESIFLFEKSMFFDVYLMSRHDHLFVILNSSNSNLFSIHSLSMCVFIPVIQVNPSSSFKSGSTSFVYSTTPESYILTSIDCV